LIAARRDKLPAMSRDGGVAGIVLNAEIVVHGGMLDGMWWAGHSAIPRVGVEKAGSDLELAEIECENFPTEFPGSVSVSQASNRV
jgi:hypothetical protein